MIFIIVAVVGVILVVVAVALFVRPPAPTNQFVTITYRTDILQSIALLPPDAGYEFLVLNMTILNDGYESFRANALYFRVTTGNVTYSIDFTTFALDKEGYTVLQPVTLGDGANITAAIAFEIPSGSSGFTFAYRGPRTYNVIWVCVDDVPICV